MSQLYRFSEYRSSPRGIFFDRAELNQLLSLYSRNVASGEWRDYAIDQLGRSAVLSVLRHTHDAPLYSIAKQGNSRAVEYVVFHGREKLKRAKTCSDVLQVFNKNLRVGS